MPIWFAPANDFDGEVYYRLCRARRMAAQNARLSVNGWVSLNDWPRRSIRFVYMAFAVGFWMVLMFVGFMAAAGAWDAIFRS